MLRLDPEGLRGLQYALDNLQYAQFQAGGARPFWRLLALDNPLCSGAACQTGALRCAAHARLAAAVMAASLALPPAHHHQAYMRRCSPDAAAAAARPPPCPSARSAAAAGADPLSLVVATEGAHAQGGSGRHAAHSRPPPFDLRFITEQQLQANLAAATDPAARMKNRDPFVAAFISLCVGELHLLARGCPDGSHVSASRSRSWPAAGGLLG